MEEKPIESKPDDIKVEIPDPDQIEDECLNQEADDKTQKHLWIRYAKQVGGALFETFVLISYWQYLLTVPMFNYWILGFLIFAFVFHIGVSLKFASSVKDNTRLIPLEYGVWISNAVQAIALSTGTQSVASSRDDDTQTLLNK